MWTLGIEGGGTKTTWCLVGKDGRLQADGTLGCGNVAVMSDEELRMLFQAIKKTLPMMPESIGAGLAGVVNPRMKVRVEALLREAFPMARTIVVDHDARAGFLAAHPSGNGLLVIAGTGSFVLGCCEGRFVRANGWGHVAGDAGSSYHLVECGLRAVFRHYDETGMVPPLGSALLATTCLNTLEDLSTWITQHAGSKKVIAGLARTVIEAGEAGCLLGLACINEATAALARSVMHVVARLHLPCPSVALSGGLLVNSELYRETFRKKLASRMPGSEIYVCTTPGALGAARLVALGAMALPSAEKPLAEVRSSNTEKRNLRTRHLDQRSVIALVDLFLGESERVVPALRKVASQLAQATEVIVTSLQRGGRLFYIGAGTSGRLGVLDASEIPPTFGSSPTQIQGIMAGGLPALVVGVERVEDDGAAGADAMSQRGVCSLDVVVGITASGRTPFVIEALAEAHRLGAKTVLLTCNPRRPSLDHLDATVDIPTEPEFLTGSTRLAAGTATKIALNLFSTLAMIRLGKVRDNLMIDVQATNAKLRDRATRIVMELTSMEEPLAHSTLARHSWNIRNVLAGEDYCNTIINNSLSPGGVEPPSEL